MEKIMTRRDIREKVFKILFGLEFNDESEMREQAEIALANMNKYDEELVAIAEDMTEEDTEYITSRVLAIVDKVADIDKTIEGISEGWKLGRIGKAELAILRLAVYEIQYDDEIPVKVAINEAVELTKAYCDVEAKSFVNALLAKLAK
jgi:N utilization substance protein B